MSALPDRTNGDPERIADDPTEDARLENFANALVAAITDITEQERQRNAAEREIALRGLESAERTEQLQYELAVAQMQSAAEQHDRRYGLGRLVVIFVGTAFLAMLLLAGLVVAMAFFGSESQSETALTILAYGVAAVGGGGAVLFVVYFANVVSRWWQRM